MGEEPRPRAMTEEPGLAAKAGKATLETTLEAKVGEEPDTRALAGEPELEGLQHVGVDMLGDKRQTEGDDDDPQMLRYIDEAMGEVEPGPPGFISRIPLVRDVLRAFGTNLSAYRGSDLRFPHELLAVGSEPASASTDYMAWRKSSLLTILLILNLNISINLSDGASGGGERARRGPGGDGHLRAPARPEPRN